MARAGTKRLYSDTRHAYSGAVHALVYTVVVVDSASKNMSWTASAAAAAD